MVGRVSGINPRKGLRRAAFKAVILLSGLLSANNSLAAVDSVVNSDQSTRAFPTDLFLRKQIRFWEHVFQHYPSTTTIIHDSDEPDRMIDLVDYLLFAKRDGRPDVISRDERLKTSQRYLERYELAADRFRRFQKDALRYGAIETRLYNVYVRSPQALSRLYSGNVHFRTQPGLSDTFLEASEKAQIYLPFMESVFKTYKIPTIVTRLVFVESMFNIDARSKVGASGIWQFMPGTARSYLHVDRAVDERNSPYKSTRAAALHLMENYQELRSWPLAITAYNHGKGGIQRAVRELRTRDFGIIARNYRGRAFGFASRNYYSEFLAAANTYDWLVRSGKLQLRTMKPSDATVVLNRRMSIGEFLRVTGVSEDVVHRYNPCLLPSAFTYYRERPLPANYELRVPITTAAHVKQVLKSGIQRQTISRR